MGERAREWGNEEWGNEERGGQGNRGIMNYY